MPTTRSLAGVARSPLTWAVGLVCATFLNLPANVSRYVELSQAQYTEWLLADEYTHGWPLTFLRRERLVDDDRMLPLWQFYDEVKTFSPALLLCNLAIIQALTIVALWLIRRRPTLRRLTLGLTTLLLLMAAAACISGMYVHYRAGYERELQALQKIQNARSAYVDMEFDVEHLVTWQQGGPLWLRAIFGDSWFRCLDRVVEIEVHGAALPYVRDLTHLRVVTVHGHDATNDTLATLSTLPKLEAVNFRSLVLDPTDPPISYIGYEGIVFLRIPKMERVHNLSVNDMYFRGDGLEDVPQLQTAYFHCEPDTDAERNPDLSDAWLAKLPEHLHLKQLIIDGEGLTDRGLHHIGCCEELTTLELCTATITPAGVEHLTKLTGLETLALESCELTDESITSLVKMQHLRQLDLSNNKFTTQGIARLRRKLPHCNIAD